MFAPPEISDIDLLGKINRVIYLNTQISDGALYLRVTEQQLNRAQITGPAVDYRCLGSSQRVRTEQRRIEPDARDPFR